jgi:hypothetical protein
VPGNVAAVPRLRRRSHSSEPEPDLTLTTAREELAAAGDAVGVLDIDVQAPGAVEEAGEHFDAAVRAFMVAGERLDGIEIVPAGLVPVGEALEETRYEVACVRALLDGGHVPEHSAPCLFDPAHGPSEQDVEWGPGDAEDRLVPACRADVARVRAAEFPHTRLVVSGGRRAYYWDLPDSYGALLEGYFARFGGVERLAELLADTPLGESLRSRA